MKSVRFPSARDKEKFSFSIVRKKISDVINMAISMIFKKSHEN
jgi:hypothetical protein